MLSPYLPPFRAGSFGKIRGQLFKDAVDGIDDRLRRAEGAVQRFFGYKALVLSENLTEQPGVAFAPAVDSLFDVTNVKKTSPAGLVLNDLVNQIGQHHPLQVARVLKLVQQPVIEFGIKSKINVEPVVSRL